jgi:hypothetical protein
MSGVLRITQDIDKRQAVLYEEKSEFRGRWLDFKFQVRFSPGELTEESRPGLAIETSLTSRALPQMARIHQPGINLQATFISRWVYTGMSWPSL